jgi:formyl-CoA transferase
VTENPSPGRAELPLTGITVVSLEQAVAAPFATRQLADLGARVIKVERPGVGDFARSYDESVGGQSSYFVWLNRSKESVTCDLKSSDGRALLERLLETADVFVQNLVPGATERIGLDAAALAERFPDLIVCDVTGYGSDGPWSGRKAYDLLVQCEVGLVSLTGTPQHPAKVGISVADIAAGMYAFSGILTALYARATARATRRVEVSLFESLAEWMGAPAHYTAGSGTQPARVGMEHATIAPYGPFTSGDGTTILIAIQNEREWSSFCANVLGDPAVAVDPRFVRGSARVANRVALNELVSRCFAGLDETVLVERLERAAVASARVNDVRGLLDHPVLAGRDRWRTVQTPSGPTRALLPPGSTPQAEARMDPVPALGEHTGTVLISLGYTHDQIARLREAGSV